VLVGRGLGSLRNGTASDATAAEAACPVTPITTLHPTNLNFPIGGVALLIGVPVAVATALYITELCPRRVRQPLTITASGDKIVIGYGQQATAQALTGGGGTLGDDPTYKQATGALGGSGVSGYFSLSKIFGLADALGALHDPGYVQARPYLNHLSYAVLGSASKGDFSTSKVIVGVKP